MKRLSLLEIIAIIVGFVAVIGAVFTIYVFTRNEVTIEAIAKGEQPSSPKIKEKENVTNTETLGKSVAVEPKETKEQSKAKVTGTIPIANGSKIDTTPHSIGVVNKIVHGKKEEKKKTTEPKAPEKKKQLIERRLKQVELNQLMANVYNLKANNTDRKACVFIRQTANSNVVAGLDDVGRLLQTRGFIIAGRERTRGKVEGIKVGWPRECLTITIGSVD